MNMKRYALFEYPWYYPSGGWNDLGGFYDSLDEAIAIAKQREDDFQRWHIVDMEKLEIVRKNYE